MSNDGKYVFFATRQQESAANSPAFINIYRADTTTGVVTRFFDWSTVVGTNLAVSYSSTQASGGGLNAYISSDGTTSVFEKILYDKNSSSTGSQYGPYYFVTTTTAGGAPQTNSILALDNVDISTTSRDGKITVATSLARTNDVANNIRILSGGKWSAVIPAGVSVGLGFVSWDSKAVFFPQSGFVVNLQTLTLSRASSLIPSGDKAFSVFVGGGTALSNGSGFNVGFPPYEYVASNNPFSLTEADFSNTAIPGIAAFRDGFGPPILDLVGSSLAVVQNGDRTSNAYIVDLISKKLLATLPFYSNYSLGSSEISENGAYYAQPCSITGVTLCYDISPTGIAATPTTGTLTLP